MKIRRGGTEVKHPIVRHGSRARWTTDDDGGAGLVHALLASRTCTRGESAVEDRVAHRSEQRRLLVKRCQVTRAIKKQVLGVRASTHREYYCEGFRHVDALEIRARRKARAGDLSLKAHVANHAPRSTYARSTPLRESGTEIRFPPV